VEVLAEDIRQAPIPKAGRKGPAIKRTEIKIADKHELL
jgi:hypothetical protein